MPVVCSIYGCNFKAARQEPGVPILRLSPGFLIYRRRKIGYYRPAVMIRLPLRLRLVRCFPAINALEEFEEIAVGREDECCVAAHGGLVGFHRF